MERAGERLYVTCRGNPRRLERGEAICPACTIIDEETFRKLVDREYLLSVVAAEKRRNRALA